MKYDVSGVPYYEVDNILPRIDKYLDKAIPYTGGRYAKEDIVESIRNRVMDLWIPINKDTKNIDGVVITQFTVYPRKKVFTILLCSGDNLGEWYSPLFNLLYEVAALNDCDLAEVVGRKGWIRRLKDEGFKQTVWIVEREV